MFNKLSNILDHLSNYLAHRKGLLPILGIIFITSNLVLILIAPELWLSRTNFLLHLGILISVIGFLLARAL